MKDGIRTEGAASCLIAEPSAEAIRNGLSRVQLAHVRELSRMYTQPEGRRNRDATWLMAKVCKEADDDGTVLMLSVSPYDGEPVSAAKLQTFYEQFGFVDTNAGIGVVVMARAPQRTKQ